MDRVREFLQIPHTGGPSGTGVRIGILDSGVDIDHSDLKGAIDGDQTKNCIGGGIPADVTDRHSHGTHLSGVIAGSGELSGGKYRGLAPNAKIVAFKVCDAVESIAPANIFHGIDAALQADIHILLVPITFSPLEQPDRTLPPWIFGPSRIEAKLREVTARGILCVVPAGNDGGYGSGTVHREGCGEDVLCIGACDHNGRIRADSGCGPSRSLRGGDDDDFLQFDPSDEYDVISREKPDFILPGDAAWAPLTQANAALVEALRSTPQSFDAAYHPMSGTSLAAAIGAALAACALEVLWSAGRPLGSNEGRVLRRILRDSARPLNVAQPAECYGAGIPRWPDIVEKIQLFRHDPRYAAQVVAS